MDNYNKSKYKIALIGNAHLDPIWLWRWQEGCNEALQTFRSALDRLKEYPDLVFTCAAGTYYRWTEELDPEMFSEIQERVREGRWAVVGGWSVQPDCNMPSGESFARHALYNQLYYYNKFGKICTTGYNVDSFGHAGSLPKLLNAGGMYTYVFMRPGMHENPDIPEHCFYWESGDGSRVLAYRIHDSYAETRPENLSKKIEYFKTETDKTGYPLMLFTGIGNHGGGPTKGDINFLRKEYCIQAENSDIGFSDPDTYFKSLVNYLPDLPVWNNELQHHASGCYSATSLVKALNRKAENMLYQAEVYDTLASKITGSVPNTKELERAWKNVLFCQFHDSLCGCSIMEAYDDISAFENEAISIAQKVMNKATIRISRSVDTWIDGIDEPTTCEIRHRGMPDDFPRTVIVFNPLSFDVKVPVRTLDPSSKVTDSEGKDVPFANVRSSRSNDWHADTEFLAEVPAFGYAAYNLYHPDFDYRKAFEKYLDHGDSIIAENEYIRAVFDTNTGYITSLVNKDSGREYAANPLAVPIIIDDTKSDTWAHNIFFFEDERGRMSLDSIEYVEHNDIRDVIRVKFRYNGSYLTEDFILAKEQKTLRIKCKADWHEKHSILKIGFDIGGSDPINTAEIPAEYIKRECSGEEFPILGWTDLTVGNAGDRYGISIVNDSKYSMSCRNTDLRQTLLRNAIFADHYSDRPLADFNYTDEGFSRFEYGIYLHEGEAEKSDVSREAQMFNIRPFCIQESCHKGNLPLKKGFLKISAENVRVTCLKTRENGSGETVIRAYETKGEPETRCYVTADFIDPGFAFDILADEIKTFVVTEEGKVLETNFMEGLVPPSCQDND